MTPMRQTIDLESGWRFSRGDFPDAASPAFNDSAWGRVTVPHDHAITGPFDRDHDLQITTIEQDGIWEKGEHTGRTAGLPHVGPAWYRLPLSVPAGEEPRRTFLEFDGVMANSEVFVNGKSVGSWPYGYASFTFEVTDALRRGGENLVAVRIEGKPDASRWYPGAGIYRNARLVVTGPTRIAQWGVTVTTPHIDDARATVQVRTELDAARGTGFRPVAGNAEGARLTTRLLNPDGTLVAEDTIEVEDSHATQKLTIDNPRLWDVASPRLYTAVSLLCDGDRVLDRAETRFGIRTAEWDAERGFVLNGRTVKLNGVCMHHDLGPLGAAHNPRALERQWDLLIEMGCNALRTSHNPPSPQLLDLCDRRGILVLDEAFDEWKGKKVANGYNSLFERWAERDLRALIRRDRNHPCVIAWSLGNEIPEQHDEACRETARFLKAICREEDPTRPVTAGGNLGKGADHPLNEEMDVAGMNYQAPRFAQYHAAHPDQPLYSSESESCISSRGEYRFPVELTKGEPSKQDNLQISSYDLAMPAWGNRPDETFAALDENPFVAGEFVWTGFDYLGEPSPYYTEWPVRSSFFGILDLCGFPKDRYYLYRSRWRTDVETLHLLPHWTWPGREGAVTPVHCYTSYAAAELFVNGVSQGVRRKDPASHFDRYRLRWNEVVYEPGVLKVVALDDQDKPVAEEELRTAGPASSIELVPDRDTITADGKDLCFVTVRVVDNTGTLCPHADHLVSLSVDGPGELAAVGNGNPSTTEPFHGNTRSAFHGLCMAIVRFEPDASVAATLSASADGLTDGTCLIHADEVRE